MLKLHAGVVGICLLLGSATPSLSADLYGLNSDASGNQIMTMNQVTGLGTTLWTFTDPDSRVYAGLAARPNDDDFLYCSSSAGDFLGGLFFSDTRLEKIEIATGTRTTFPDLSHTDLGLVADYTFLLIHAVAISPNDADTVVISVGALPGDFFSSLPPRSFLLFLNADTGLAVAPEVETTDSLESLAFSFDGATLYGGLGVSGTKLVTVNPATGTITPISPVAIPTTLAGLSFNPDDGTLFAMIADLDDELVTMSEIFGSVTTTLGAVGTQGPTGLAFVPFYNPVIPVPAMGNRALLGLAISLIAVTVTFGMRPRRVQ